MIELFDTHAHLDFEDFDKDREEVLRRAHEAGVMRMVSIGGGRGIESNRKALALAEKYDYIFATVGIHPHDAKIMSPEIMAELASLAQREKVVAIGEIGMDLAKEYSPRQVQKQVFRDQLALAKSLELPIVIHDREAHSECLWIFKADGVGRAGGIMHCFSGDAEQAKYLIKMGFYISIPGVVTYKNARKLLDVVRAIPLEKMLIETDCPFLTPEPNRGQRNEPAFVRHVAETIAALRGIPLEKVAEQTTKNADTIFNLAG